MNIPRDMPRPDDHEARMEIVRAVAEWHLGSAGWAGELVGAYLYPQAAFDALTADKDPA